MCVFHQRLSICMFASFPFGFEGRMWDSIVLNPNYCRSIHLKYDKCVLPVIIATNFFSLFGQKSFIYNQLIWNFP